MEMCGEEFEIHVNTSILYYFPPNLLEVENMKATIRFFPLTCTAATYQNGNISS